MLRWLIMGSPDPFRGVQLNKSVGPLHFFRESLSPLGEAASANRLFSSTGSSPARERYPPFSGQSSPSIPALYRTANSPPAITASRIIPLNVPGSLSPPHQLLTRAMLICLSR